MTERKRHLHLCKCHHGEHADVPRMNWAIVGVGAALMAFWLMVAVMVWLAIRA